MTSIAERVAFLEGQAGEQLAATNALRVEVGELRRDIDRRFERLEDKFDRRFTWLVGTQVALLVAVVGALAAPYFN
jgi:hypothetical protein